MHLHHIQTVFLTDTQCSHDAFQIPDQNKSLSEKEQPKASLTLSVCHKISESHVVMFEASNILKIFPEKTLTQAAL